MLMPPPPCEKNSFSTTPSVAATTGAPSGAMISIASWTREPPARACVNVSINWFGFTPMTGRARPAGPTCTPSAIATCPASVSTCLTSPAGVTRPFGSAGLTKILYAKIQNALVRIAVTTAVDAIVNLRPMQLRLEDRREAGLQHPRQAQHVPIGHPDAAARFGPPDGLRLIGAVDSVMFFGEVEPGDADGSVRAGRKLHVLLALVSPLEQLRLIVERRQERVGRRLPAPDR